MKRPTLEVEATAPVRALPELVDLYLLRCQVEGKSVQTVSTYRYTLGRFQAARRHPEFSPTQVLTTPA